MREARWLKTFEFPKQKTDLKQGKILERAERGLSYMKFRSQITIDRQIDSGGDYQRRLFQPNFIQ